MFVTYVNKKPSKRGSIKDDATFVDFILKKDFKMTDAKVYSFQENDFITTEQEYSNTIERMMINNVTGVKYITKLIKNFIKEKNFTEETKSNFYTEFKIPKKKGGYRKLIKTENGLGELQRSVLDCLVNDLKLLPHNAAHAYTKDRSPKTHGEVHKQSKWVISLDLKDFFNSITTEILQDKLPKIASLNYNMAFKNNNDVDLRSIYKEFVDLVIFISTYKGSLPQGSNLSPLLSNLIMIEFDYKIEQAIKEDKIRYAYFTRYADDIFFSAVYRPSKTKIIELVENTLEDVFKGSIVLNKDKTKMLKNTNRCYLLGLKLNKDNQITIGHENKRKLKHDLFNLFMAEKENQLTVEMVQEVLGYFSYLQNIEPGYANYIQKKMLKKFNSPEFTFAKHFKL